MGKRTQKIAEQAGDLAAELAKEAADLLVKAFEAGRLDTAEDSERAADLLEKAHRLIKASQALTEVLEVRP